MPNKTGPGPRWYSMMNVWMAKRLANKVKEELELRPDLKDLLKERLESFAIWAGEQRLNYEEDIDEEVTDFLSGNFRTRQRLQQTNVSGWMKLRGMVFKRDKYTCVYCGANKVKLECDHVIPFSKGGSDERENIVTACYDCNRSKRDMSAEDFKSKLIKK